MKMHAKTIKTFLIDGTPNGSITCELSNWTGKAIKIPRKRMKQFLDKYELKSTGVYILIGITEDESEKETAYIGESEELCKRLEQHLREKDFWTEAIVLLSKDENLNKAHIKYLENRFYKLAEKVGRYSQENRLEPVTAKLSEADMAEMEEFMDNAKLLVNSLGYKIFEELIDTDLTDKEREGQTFYIKTANADARGQLTDEGFVVLKGAIVACDMTNAASIGWKNMREKLEKERIIIERNGIKLFDKNYLFKSPSAAASIVMGHNASGVQKWKMNNGKTLKEIEAGN